jgi:steroid 5-alpha reductase family enzyme
MLFSFDPLNILAALIVSFAIQALFFAFAASLKTDKVTDLSYSLSFAIISILLVLVNRAYAPVQLIEAAFIVAWAARLGIYLLARILKIGKDARFDDKRGNFLVFLRFWILQAVAVWAIMLPATVLLSVPAAAPLGPVSLAGAVIWAIGFAIEVASDAQKYAFRNDPKNKGRWIRSGLWKYSRHPNYFGETLLWWGLFVLALPSLPASALFTLLGPVFITLLLLFVSGVPLLEKSAEEKHGKDPEYQAYKRRTSLFVLMPPRKESKGA